MDGWSISGQLLLHSARKGLLQHGTLSFRVMTTSPLWTDVLAPPCRSTDVLFLIPPVVRVLASSCGCWSTALLIISWRASTLSFAVFINPTFSACNPSRRGYESISIQTVPCLSPSSMHVMFQEPIYIQDTLVPRHLTWTLLIQTMSEWVILPCLSLINEVVRAKDLA